MCGLETGSSLLTEKRSSESAIAMRTGRQLRPFRCSPAIPKPASNIPIPFRFNALKHGEPYCFGYCYYYYYYYYYYSLASCCGLTFVTLVAADDDDDDDVVYACFLFLFATSLAKLNTQSTPLLISLPPETECDFLINENKTIVKNEGKK